MTTPIPSSHGPASVFPDRPSLPERVRAVARTARTQLASSGGGPAGDGLHHSSGTGSALTGARQVGALGHVGPPRERRKHAGSGGAPSPRRFHSRGALMAAAALSGTCQRSTVIVAPSSFPGRLCFGGGGHPSGSVNGSGGCKAACVGRVMHGDRRVLTNEAGGAHVTGAYLRESPRPSRSTLAAGQRLRNYTELDCGCALVAGYGHAETGS